MLWGVVSSEFPTWRRHLEQLANIKLASLSKMAFFFYWFIWISFLKNILRSSLIQTFNIPKCISTSITNPNLIISLKNLHRIKFLPALEQMTSWEFLHIWLLFFFVRSQLVGYWQASPDHPLSHLHFPQSHLPWPNDLTTSS